MTRGAAAAEVRRKWPVVAKGGAWHRCIKASTRHAPIPRPPHSQRALDHVLDVQIGLIGAGGGGFRLRRRLQHVGVGAWRFEIVAQKVWRCCGAPRPPALITLQKKGWSSITPEGSREWACMVPWAAGRQVRLAGRWVRSRPAQGAGTAN